MKNSYLGHNDMDCWNHQKQAQEVDEFSFAHINHSHALLHRHNRRYDAVLVDNRTDPRRSGHDHDVLGSNDGLPVDDDDEAVDDDLVQFFWQLLGNHVCHQLCTRRFWWNHRALRGCNILAPHHRLFLRIVFWCPLYVDRELRIRICI